MLPSATENGLVVLLRLPLKGKVKSRIAAQSDADTALRIYQSLVEITLDTLSVLPIPIYLLYEGGLPDEKLRHGHMHYALQADGDLGEKIGSAVELGLSHHSYVVIIGSDCPELSHAILTEAFDRLRTYDVVLGPAVDGGYYLIGCKKASPTLFENIAWGSDQVLSVTMERCRQLQASVFLLPVLRDIDELADWNNFLEKNGPSLNGVRTE